MAKLNRMLPAPAGPNSRDKLGARLRLPLLLFGLLMLFGAQPGRQQLFAQSSGSPITSGVDRTTLSTDETVTLNVTVLDTNASRPTLPVLDGFHVTRSSFVSQRTVVNGVATEEATYSYLLQPTRVGELLIPPVTITVDGQEFATDPITIQVTQGAAPPQPATPGENLPPPSDAELATFFVEAEVDNTAPYLGQQVNYIFRFFQAETLFRAPGYVAPDFAGFWNQQETEQSQYFMDRQAGGQTTTYRVTELRTILFPTVVGERTIEAAALEFPGSLLRSGAVLQSDPVTLVVKPPPNPAPAEFSGAVGKLSITATVEPSEVAVNEPVTLRVTMQGEGNIETLPDPALPDLAAWRAFPKTTSTVSAQVQDGVLVGNKVFEQLLVPTAPGDYLIPGISYSYFNPESETYETTTSEPVSVLVLDGGDQEPIPAVPGVERETVEQIDSDIRFIKPAPSSLSSASAPLTENLFYWTIWLLPLFVIIADWRWQRRQQIRAANPALVRRSRAAKSARSRLARARQQDQKPAEVVGAILSDYLSDKLDTPVAGLTQSALAELLIGLSIDEPTVNSVCDLLAVAELDRFAPTGDAITPSPVDLIGETERLISELEALL